MKIRLVGDIHIGSKIAHGTKETQKVFDEMRDGAIQQAFDTDLLVFQLGDLFDKFEVNSTDFVQGVKYANRCHTLIQGNHDTSKDQTRRSAFNNLALLSARGPDHFVGSRLIKSLFKRVKLNGYGIYCVPHHESNQVFQQALEDAMKHSNGLGSAKKSILLLHANYNRESDVDNDNNVTLEMAGRLKRYFALIFSGHEHAHNPGSIYRIGSIIPMSFGEMADKYYVDVDLANMEITKHMSWTTHKGYYTVSGKNFLEMDQAVDFLEITGEVSASEILPIAKHRVKLLSEGLCMAIRDSTYLPTTLDLKQELSSECIEDWRVTLREILPERLHLSYDALLKQQDMYAH